MRGEIRPLMAEQGNRWTAWACAAGLCLVLSGCAGLTGPGDGGTTAPVEEESISNATRQGAATPAVVALLDQAESQRAGGELERAVATVERALRIEPRNARLWYRLAELRLAMNMPQRAEQLAMKAKALAVANPALIEQSWRLIAQSRYQRGDTAGASAALQEAAKYRD